MVRSAPACCCAGRAACSCRSRAKVRLRKPPPSGEPTGSTGKAATSARRSGHPTPRAFYQGTGSQDQQGWKGPVRVCHGPPIQYRQDPLEPYGYRPVGHFGLLQDKNHDCRTYCRSTAYLLPIDCVSLPPSPLCVAQHRCCARLGSLHRAGYSRTADVKGNRRQVVSPVVEPDSNQGALADVPDLAVRRGTRHSPVGTKLSYGGLTGTSSLT